MKFVVFILMLSLSLFAKSDETISVTLDQLLEKNIEVVKEYVNNGYDIRKDGDRALHVAVLTGRAELEYYLRTLGLTENATYLGKVWRKQHLQVHNLQSRESLYRLDNYTFPTLHQWKTDLRCYDKKECDHDIWGGEILYKEVLYKGKLERAFCSLGRDKIPGGNGYDMDICSDMGIREIISLLDEIKKKSGLL